MIIKQLKHYFTVEFEKEDWFQPRTYDLLELLKKSIPKDHRRYDYNRKLWIVSYQYIEYFRLKSFYTEQEELEGLLDYQQFIRQFA